MSYEAFAPIDGATVLVDVGASSGRVKVREGAPGSFVAVEVMNNGSATAWIRGGTVATDAAVTDIPVGPATCKRYRFQIPATGVLYIAAIAAGSTGKIYFTPGDGV